MYRTHAAGALCGACKHDSDCIYQAETSGAILQCEQFELGSGGITAGRHGPDPHAPNPDPPAWDRSEGLCANCDHRAICIYPKPEGGVWRCEEYV